MLTRGRTNAISDRDRELERLVGRVTGARPRRPVPERELLRLGHAPASQLARELGLAPRAAESLAAAFDLGRTVERLVVEPGSSLTDPESVAAILRPLARGLDRETFWALPLDGRHRLIEPTVVSIGTLTCSLVHPREVFAPALRWSAAALVVAHNHPSGDPTPSAEDIEVTRRLRRAGEILGIPLLDHVVLGGRQHRSLRRDPSWGPASSPK